MSVYMILTREQTLNEQEMKTYSKLAGPTLEGHQAKPLAFYGEQEILEGPSDEGTVIIEFPTAEAAHAWYDSPSYREAREHRLAGAVYRVSLVKGV